MKHSKTLKQLLKLYDKEMAIFVKKLRKRVVDAHAKYGEDWKIKDCLKERDDEIYDLINYTIMDQCQKKWKNKQSIS